MSNNPIYVTKAFLPPIEEYQEYLQKIWDSNHITNNGPLLKEFERSIKEYLNIQNFHFVTNGTIALQIAIRAFEFEEGEIITTPFSYVATTSAIMWEGFTPVYADIDPGTLCLNPNNIESLITSKTRAIIPVHVFGNSCDIEKIEAIAKKHNLKVIYDAAHSFGVEHNGKSVFEYGDISITSFHATKLFNTIEGGGIFTKDKEIHDKIDLIKRFGHFGDDHKMLGINAKASEFQAAMGLANLKYINKIIEDRKRVYLIYDQLLAKKLSRQSLTDEIGYNYSYFPIIFPSENDLFKALGELDKYNIYPRRYFHPSLNTLPYLKETQSCGISEQISRTILCLPMYYNIEESKVENICKIINGCIV